MEGAKRHVRLPRRPFHGPPPSGLALALLGVALLPAAWAITWHVVVDSSRTPERPSSAFSVPSLTEAVRKASSGDSIVLPRGIHQVEEDVVLRSGVQLLSAMDLEARDPPWKTFSSHLVRHRPASASTPLARPGGDSERPCQIEPTGRGQSTPISSEETDRRRRSEGDGDCVVLQKLFNDTGGERWLNHSGWSLVMEGRCCDDGVFGVTCEKGRVVNL